MYRWLGVTTLVGVLFAVAIVTVSRSRHQILPADAASDSVVVQTPTRSDTVREASSPPNEEVVAEESDETVDAWVEELPKCDRSLGQKIIDASDNDDLESLRRLVPHVRVCTNAAVRLRMVESLDWFGKDAVVELTLFLVDSNSEVAKAAFDAWDTAVDQIEDELFRIRATAELMKTLTDPECISAAAIKLECVDDRKAALLALIEVAESGNRFALKSVKESYEFITGDEWSGIADARAKATTIDAEE